MNARLLGLLIVVPLPAAATTWDALFTRPAFIVTRPTTLHAAAGQAPLQILRPGDQPVDLSDDSLHTGAAGGRYRRLASGELVLVRTPTGNGPAESKGRLVYRPARPPLRSAVPAATPLYAGTVPDDPAPGELLPADQSLEALYAVPTGHGGAVFVRHAYGQGWVSFDALQWERPPVVAAPTPTPDPPPLHQTVERLLEQYNQGVQRAQAYYLATTGQHVAARTFGLAALEESATGLRLRLSRRDGHLPLDAEAVLARLLAQELGRDLSIEWP